MQSVSRIDNAFLVRLNPDLSICSDLVLNADFASLVEVLAHTLDPTN